MKIGDKISGFFVVNISDIPDAAATAYELTHEKTGARLIYLDRADESKTFAVAFRTVPCDDTGVFHIIEHSVLCGSKKYPARDPFAELLKGSLQTFLNAMTYPDKTVYPISTQNEKDFMNLVDVYLDAVFNPLMLENENIFMQEGFRLEPSGDTIEENGIVYNEMRGAYSSVEEIAETEAARVLHRGSCYEYDSGGDPDAIRSLSFEDFKAAYEKYYHPSNAYFILDGAIPLFAVLEKIDGYIRVYEKRSDFPEICDSLTRGIRHILRRYEISEEESVKNSGRIAYSALTTRLDECEESIALDIALDAIAGSREAPLQKRLLDSGMLERVVIGGVGGKLRQFVTVELQNVKDGKYREAKKLLIKALSDIASEGICREHLTASLNRLEFAQREKETGSCPIGVHYAIAVLEDVMHGGTVLDAISYSKIFASLREKIGTGYFESLIKKYLVEARSGVFISLRPSKTLAREREAERETRLRAMCEKMGKRELSALKKKAREHLRWQEMGDSKEALAKIPKLSISDIPKEICRTPCEVISRGGHEIIRCRAELFGIVYAGLWFSLPEISDDELTALRLTVAMLSHSGTDTKDALSLQNLIKSELGSLDASIFFASDERCYIKLSVSALESKKEKLPEIIGEYLYKTRLDDKAAILNTLRSGVLAMKNSFLAAGDDVAFEIAASSGSGANAMRRRLFGYEAYLGYRELLSDFDGKADALILKMRELRDRIFRKEALSLSILSKETDEALEDAILGVCREGSSKKSFSEVAPFEKRRTAMAIPSEVGYAAASANFSELGLESCGSLFVARVILNYEYLWEEIRVRGGAYGAAFRLRDGEHLGFTSYRDPSPKKSLEVFCRAGDFLIDFAERNADVSRYIIAAIGETEPLLSTPTRTALAVMDHFRGRDAGYRARIRREILETDAKKLREIGEALRKFAAHRSEAVLLPQGELAMAKDEFEEILYFR